MSELLNYVANVQESEITPEFDPSYLNKVFYVCKSNYATPEPEPLKSRLAADPWDGSPQIIEIFTYEEAAQYTDDANIQGFFGGGMSSVILVVVDEIEDLTTLTAKSSTAYSLVLSTDFTFLEYSESEFNFEGLIFFFVRDYESEKAFFALSKVSGFVSQDATDTNTYKALAFALGTQLSQSDYTNLQYIKSPYLQSGGVTTKGQANNLFNDRATFYFSDVQYGNVLAGWFAGGLPITYYLIKETINYELQQQSYTFIANKQPLNDEQQRLAMQSYLNRKVINFYVDKGYLGSELKNTLVVSDSDKTYFVDIRPEYVIPNPIWRVNIVIQASASE